MISQRQLIDSARAPILAFNGKDWDTVRTSVTPDLVYDELATNRKVEGVEQVISCWQGWATAFPDAKATFHREFPSGNTVVFEVSWRGTHQGPLQTPAGPIAPTGKRIDVGACMIVEVADDRVTVQRHYFDMLTLLQQIGADV
jgi:steroid delta-isomerase-like uncharacterized protein